MFGEIQGEVIRMQYIPFRINTPAGRRDFINAHQTQVETILQRIATERFDRSIVELNQGLDKEIIGNLIIYFGEVQEYMRANPASLEQPNVLTFNLLEEAYSIIGRYFDNVGREFGGQYIIGREDFLRVPRTVRIRNIENVWLDFFRGDLPDRGFFFWILLGALIDIAGFIFFYIAFAKRNDY